MFGYIKGKLDQWHSNIILLCQGKNHTRKTQKLKRDYSNDFHLYSHMLQIYNEEITKNVCQRMPQVIYKELCVPNVLYPYNYGL